MKPTLLAATACLTIGAHAETTPPLGHGINTFGLALHQRLAAAGGNQVASPWSIQSALAMTHAGANGKTREEIATTLHFPAADTAVHATFSTLAADLHELARASRAQVENPQRHGGPNTPLEITTANRLFGQQGFPFAPAFLDLLRDAYAAPLETLDFKSAPEPARLHINQWVAQQTRDRIPDLLPPGSIDPQTRLVLTNAVYMKAPWQNEFTAETDAPFHIDGAQPVNLPGLSQESHFRHLEVPGGTITAVPYAHGGLQFLIIVPHEKDGLAAMEKSLTADHLHQATTAERRLIRLHFPQFKLEPAAISLADHLSAMGMPTAFDKPAGSADFTRMVRESSPEYGTLFLSDVFHQAFIAVDQYGTEAAAATAAIIAARSSARVPIDEPLVIRADRPFAFAIQHIDTSTCLFLGRVTDPR